MNITGIWQHEFAIKWGATFDPLPLRHAVQNFDSVLDSVENSSKLTIEPKILGPGVNIVFYVTLTNFLRLHYQRDVTAKINRIPPTIHILKHGATENYHWSESDKNVSRGEINAYEAKYSVLDNCYSNNLTLEWKQDPNDTDIFMDLVAFQNSTQDGNSFNNTLTFPKFSLKIETEYHFVVQSSIEGMGIVASSEIEIYVRTSNPVVIISPQKTTIRSEESFTLDASASYDPNVDDEENAANSFAYTWKCFSNSYSHHCLELNGSIYTLNVSTPTLTVPGNTLKPNQELFFNVKIKKNDYFSSYSVKVIVVGALPYTELENKMESVIPPNITMETDKLLKNLQYLIKWFEATEQSVLESTTEYCVTNRDCSNAGTCEHQKCNCNKQRYLDDCSMEGIKYGHQLQIRNQLMTYDQEVLQSDLSTEKVLQSLEILNSLTMEPRLTSNITHLASLDTLRTVITRLSQHSTNDTNDVLDKIVTILSNSIEFVHKNDCQVSFKSSIEILRRIFEQIKHLTEEVPFLIKSKPEAYSWNQCRSRPMNSQDTKLVPQILLHKSQFV